MLAISWWPEDRRWIDGVRLLIIAEHVDIKRRGAARRVVLMARERQDRAEAVAPSRPVSDIRHYSGGEADIMKAAGVGGRTGRSSTGSHAVVLSLAILTSFDTASPPLTIGLAQLRADNFGPCVAFDLTSAGLDPVCCHCLKR